MRKKPTLAILALLTGLSACALTLKTWQIDAGNVPPECQNVEPLVRKKHGKIEEALTIAKSHGYRCYSELDDDAWRTELKTQRICCEAK